MIDYGSDIGNLRRPNTVFQVLMPNSPLLLNYLSFGTSFLQESRFTTEVFILVFSVECVPLL